MPNLDSGTRLTVRVLILVGGFSYPPREGMHAQLCVVLRALLRRDGFEVRLVPQVRHKRNLDSDEFVRHYPSVDLTPVYSELTYPLQALRSLLPAWFDVYREVGGRSPMDPDIVHIEGFGLIPLVRTFSNKPVILSVIDAWSLRQVRLAEGRAWPMRHVLMAYGRFARWIERAYLHRARYVHVVSGEDARYLRRINPRANVQVIPIAAPEVPQTALFGGTNNICFWGDISVPHLRAGLRWLLAGVWPRIKSALPGAQLTVLGRHPREVFFSDLERSDVVFKTWVADLAAEFAACDAVVLPDQSGTGLKNRVISSMAHGMPVLGSSFAFEGIPVENGVHAYVTDDPAQFAGWLLRVCQEARCAQTLGAHAREFVQARYSEEAIGTRWAVLYRQALDRPSN